MKNTTVRIKIQPLVEIRLWDHKFHLFMLSITFSSTGGRGEGGVQSYVSLEGIALLFIKTYTLYFDNNSRKQNTFHIHFLTLWCRCTIPTV